MILVLSDIHFGKDGYLRERDKERDLVRCMRSLEGDVRHLILLGDVFECFIEYRHLVPKGFIRFQSLLAEWADGGTSISYLAGNHDPWHIDYFEREFGATVVADELIIQLGKRSTYFHHGDGISSRSPLYNRLRQVLRHPLPVWLYRNLLPGDFGTALARRVSTKMGEDEIDELVARDLRAAARAILSETISQVVMGHSHIAELRDWPEGRYINPGAWHETRTLLRLDSEETQLLHWNGYAIQAYHDASIPAA